MVLYEDISVGDSCGELGLWAISIRNILWASVVLYGAPLWDSNWEAFYGVSLGDICGTVLGNSVGRIG